MTKLSKEQLRRKIVQLYSLRQHKALLDKKVKALSEQIKEELLGQEEPYVVGEIVATIVPHSKPATLEQYQLDDFFSEAGLFQDYAELYIPEHAIDYAYHKGDISEEDLVNLRRVDTTYALQIEAKEKSDVQSEDDVHSER